MPIHLTTNSRRRFLQTGSGAILASILTETGPPVFAAQGKETWALLSDTHIAADETTVSRQGVNMTENLRRVVAEVAADREGLTGVIIDGDCAYLEGQRGDYGTLAALLEPLRQAGLPIHMTLGNHDDRAPFYSAFSDQRHDPPAVQEKHVSVVRGGAVDWVFLDSLRHVNKVEGEFGPSQLDWLRKVLVELKGRPVILAGHHYPQEFRENVIGGAEKAKISGLVDSEAFLELVAAHPQVKAYIFGHSHDWGVRTSSGCHFVNLPPTAYVFKPDRPNGWVKAAISDAGMTLELRALDTGYPEHGKVLEFGWR